MKVARLILLFTFLSAFTDRAATGGLIDSSDSVFFPAEVGSWLRTYKSFPVFWWNFFVLDYRVEDDALTSAREACDLLSAEPSLARVECGSDLSRYEPLIADWAGDHAKRHGPLSGAEARARLDLALSRASLPLPSSLFRILRHDPFDSHRELMELATSRLKMKLVRKGGFLTDAAARRIVIPIQPSFPPSESESLISVRQRLAAWGFLGPHAATLENKQRIFRDLDMVSWLGVAVWAIFLVILGLKGHWRLCTLFPPVVLGSVLSAISVILIFGSVHGLTLSFGVGIIGLTVDYGLHLAFSPEPDRVWRSNAAGFATTMACLVLLMFSTVPLIRQLMIFSALGFVYSYLLLFAMQRTFPRLLTATPYPLKLRSSRARMGVVGVLGIGAVVGVAALRPQLGIRHFDYQSARTKELSEWFFKAHVGSPPLFQIEEATSAEATLTRAHSHLAWAKERSIGIESPAVYVPTLEAQRANLDRWKVLQCRAEPFSRSLPQATQKIFFPFLEGIACERLVPQALQGAVPAYLSHLWSDRHWLTLWLPQTKEESELITASFPSAKSLAEVVEVFPQLLSKQLAWMGPLAVFLVGLTLFVYYRSAVLAGIALIPFFSGVGLVTWVSILFDVPLSFVSLVAIVMILGLSVDYAIFAIDHFRFYGEGAEMGNASEAGAATALVYAATTTLAGFLPLVFCQHQVLAHLGRTLTLGTLGTILGAAWGIPMMKKWIAPAKS